MSREIKFKFWLGHTKKMTYEHSLIEISHAHWDFTEDIIPLQFTGLKDKNGVDIYEGDLVNTEDSGLARPDDVLAVKYSGGAFVIYNPNCCEICKKGSGCISNLDEWRVDKYIVIGNIYENAELLK